MQQCTFTCCLMGFTGKCRSLAHAFNNVMHQVANPTVTTVTNLTANCTQSWHYSYSLRIFFPKAVATHQVLPRVRLTYWAMLQFQEHIIRCEQDGACKQHATNKQTGSIYG